MHHGKIKSQTLGRKVKQENLMYKGQQEASRAPNIKKPNHWFIKLLLLPDQTYVFWHFLCVITTASQNIIPISFFIRKRNNCEKIFFFLNCGSLQWRRKMERRSTNIFSPSSSYESMKGPYMHLCIPPNKVCAKISFQNRSHEGGRSCWRWWRKISSWQLRPKR